MPRVPATASALLVLVLYTFAPPNTHTHPAFMDEAPRLEFDTECAWVTCEGEVLPLFAVEVDPEANKVSAWIPSEADKVRPTNPRHIWRLI